MTKFFKIKSNPPSYSFSVLTLFMLFMQYCKSSEPNAYVVWASDNSTNPNNDFNCVDLLRFSVPGKATDYQIQMNSSYYALECPEANLTTIPFLTNSLPSSIIGKINLNRGVSFPNIYICDNEYAISFSGQCITLFPLPDEIKKQFELLSICAAKTLQKGGCQVAYPSRKLDAGDIVGIVLISLLSCALLTMFNAIVIPYVIFTCKKRKQDKLNQDQQKLINDVEDATILARDKNFSFSYGTVSKV